MIRAAAAVSLAAMLFTSAQTARAQGRGTLVAPIKTLVVTGDVPTSLLLQVDELKALPRTKVTVSESGKSVAYEGVLVAELLKKAGAPMGDALRGKALASYVLARGSDGYEVLMSLVELDTDLTASTIIVADTVDGQSIDARNGPLRLIVPKDSHPSRSVRMLERLEVVRLRK
jgi:DMSO/TMAO reductase YedYZ molybdopterin-dependent catalytic subunit